MKTLRPAHEVVVEKIRRHCENLLGIESAMANYLPSASKVPVSGLTLGRLQEIGGLCSLLETLSEMIIPEDKLGEVIQVLVLGALGYRHAVIDDTREKLIERMPAKA